MFCGLLTRHHGSQSTINAEEKVGRLYELVDQTLKQNVMLAERLLSLQTGSIVPPETAEAASPSDPARNYEPIDLGQNLPVDPGSDPDPGIRKEPREFVFEELLKNSRVYRKIAFDGSDIFSILSAAGRTGSWCRTS
jgi:hypothetical protein